MALANERLLAGAKNSKNIVILDDLPGVDEGSMYVKFGKSKEIIAEYKADGLIGSGGISSMVSFVVLYLLMDTINLFMAM